MKQNPYTHKLNGSCERCAWDEGYAAYKAEAKPDRAELQLVIMRTLSDKALVVMSVAERDQLADAILAHFWGDDDGTAPN